MQVAPRQGRRATVTGPRRVDDDDTYQPYGKSEQSTNAGVGSFHNNTDSSSRNGRANSIFGNNLNAGSQAKTGNEAHNSTFGDDQNAYKPTSRPHGGGNLMANSNSSTEATSGSGYQPSGAGAVAGRRRRTFLLGGPVSNESPTDAPGSSQVRCMMHMYACMCEACLMYA
jgi:hypothetical protein